MNLFTLRDVLQSEIEDLYSAEDQILEALPKVISHVTTDSLRSGLKEHLQQTKKHRSRLEEIAQDLQITVPGKNCVGMEGVLKEGAELLKLKPSVAVDAALIAACQRVEHYEIAGYGSAYSFAEELSLPEVADLLQTTLQEEVDADEKLSSVAETEVNGAAAEVVEEKN